MIKPDFAKYSLALIKDDKLIFFSDKSGLRPLVECIKKYKSKVKDCTLHDKIIGLAAARIIVYSGIISNILANVLSKSAKELLKKNNISIKAQLIVGNILTEDKLSICPMELKAQDINNKSFFLQMKKIFKL